MAWRPLVLEIDRSPITPEVAFADVIADVICDPSLEIGIAGTLRLKAHRMTDALQFAYGKRACPRIDGSFQRGVWNQRIHQRAIECFRCLHQGFYLDRTSLFGLLNGGNRLRAHTA